MLPLTVSLGMAPMPSYRVEVKAPAREVYIVDADSPKEAAERVYDGECIVSEVEIGEVVGVTRDEDFDE